MKRQAYKPHYDVEVYEWNARHLWIIYYHNGAARNWGEAKSFANATRDALWHLSQQCTYTLTNGVFVTQGRKEEQP